MSTENRTHPADGRLREFAAGMLCEAETSGIAAHLDVCAACRDLVDGFLTGDSFLEKLQSASRPESVVPEDAHERRLAASALLHEARNLGHAGPGQGLHEISMPHQVGDYVVLREMARGGMGVVYQARHRGSQRPVALKMILAGGFASEAEHQRFRREAEMAARVQHPNIVQVYEVGLHDGRPFLAMEWVGGGTLADRIGEGPWLARDAAALVETLARAIDVAHRRGVVHRDLKPSNILLQVDGDGTPGGPLAGMAPKVADFGLARPTDGEARLTATGLTVGTPEYMAPEQAEGTEVGPPADIYALGAVLYQLLTGSPPFRGATPFEVLQAVIHTEPVTPRRYRRHLPRDLETIALKAIEKDPSRRYATAAALADDLRRFLSGESILARPPNAGARLWKWTARRPALASLAGILVAVTVLAFGGITALWVDAAAARDQARAAASEARRRGDAERRARYQAGIAAASSALELNHTGAARAQLLDVPEEHRNWEWRHFFSQLDTAQAVFRGHGGAIAALAIGGDGRLAGSGSEVGAMILWDISSGEKIAHARGHTGRITSMRISPDGRSCATVSSDATIRLYDAGTGRELRVLRGHAGPILSASFSPDGRRLASASEDRTVRVWDVAGGGSPLVLEGHTDIVRVVEFSPDGSRLASAGRDPIVRLWDPITGERIQALRGHTAGVHALTYRPDGKAVATGGDYPDNMVRLWDAGTGAPLATMPGHENEVGCLAFSPDGSRFASGSFDQTVRLWDGDSGRLIKALRGHSGWISQLAFSPGGTRLASASHDQTLRLWDALDGELVAVLRGHEGVALNVAYSPDGKQIVSSSSDRTLRVWDVETIERNGVFRGHTSYVYDVAFNRDGSRLASAGWDHTVRFWDVATGRKAGLLRHDSGTGGRSGAIKFDAAYIVSLAFDPGGRRLATVSRDDRVYVWDLTTGGPPRVLDVPTDDWGVHPRAAFDPSGEVLCTGGADGVVRLWDATTGRPMAELRGHAGCASDVAFRPDGAVLATGGADGTVRLWDIAARAPLAVSRAHAGPVHRVVFSGDGRLLASASDDQTVRLWGPQSGAEPAVLAHGGSTYGVAFSPDATRLATACSDNIIRLWEIASGRQVAELRGHRAYVHAVAFSPDGTRLASCSGDATVRIWGSLPPQGHERRSVAEPGR